MATSRKGYPAIPANIWWRLRDRFRNAPPKGDVTKDYLVAVLGLGDKVAANVMPQLKQALLVDDSNRLTSLAMKWRDDQTYPDACREIVEKVYPDGLKDVSPPDQPDLAAATRWFLNETGAGAPRARQLATFYVMVAHADLAAATDRAPRRPRAAAASERPASSGAGADRGKGNAKAANAARDGQIDGAKPPAPSLSIAIQVYVDKDMTPEQVDHVFASMARHLYGKE